MSAQIATIKNLYADFARGDVAAILAVCSTDSCWTIPGAPHIPYAGVHAGIAAIAKFFVGLGTHLNIEEFTPIEFYGDQARVVVIGKYSGKGRLTGKSFTSNWAHCWHFSDGRIAAFDDCYDTLAVASVLS